MVDFNELINNIITEIELEHIVIMSDEYSNHRVCIDLDYLRHHPKLKDARIFRLIMGFECGMWKKPEYDKSKYCKIFKDFDIHIFEWRILREFLNNGCILGKDDKTTSLKFTTLQKISTTFGGIPSIDKYLFELSQIKEEPIYNPQKPSEDYKDMYFWSAYDAYPNTSYLGTWQAIHSQRNGWSICNMEKMDNTRTQFYARKSKK